MRTYVIVHIVMLFLAIVFNLRRLAGIDPMAVPFSQQSGVIAVLIQVCLLVWSFTILNALPV